MNNISNPVSQDALLAPSASESRLGSVLEKTETVQELVEQSADELLIVNAVLKKNIPNEARDGDIAQALDMSTDMEEKLQQSASELAQVNDALAHEIEERHRLEKELSTVINALGQSQRLVP